MPDNWYILSGILVAAGVTWALRAIPFAMLAPLRESALLDYLGKRMPVGIMFILVVYTVGHVNLTALDEAIPMVVALGMTIGLHLWRRNPTLSIFAGTGVYVLLASTLPAVV
ncbi:AzlD domain-containing protein [Actinomycetaceae bacterium L2_0104]